MKTNIILAAILLVLILCITVVWFCAFKEKERPEGLIIIKPKFGNISMNVTATGTIEPVTKDPAKMRITASVNKACFDNLKPGERVAFTVDAFAGDVFYGAVKKICLKPVVSSGIVTYTAVIDVMNDSLKLKPGMMASISFYTKQEDSTMLIPLKALNFSPDSHLVNETIIKNPYPHTNKNSNPGISVHQYNDNTKSISTNVQSECTFYKEQYVWVKADDELLQRRIFVGLNDDINIQVVYGLTDEDEIVTGINTNREQKSASKASD